jgi:hypothetical protein
MLVVNIIANGESVIYPSRKASDQNHNSYAENELHTIPSYMR